jgi:hypothetical protein
MLIATEGSPERGGAATASEMMEARRAAPRQSVRPIAVVEGRMLMGWEVGNRQA